MFALFQSAHFLRPLRERFALSLSALIRLRLHRRNVARFSPAFFAGAFSPCRLWRFDTSREARALSFSRPIFWLFGEICG